MAQPGNSLAGFLAVYAQKSLEQFIADMPLLGRFTTDFSDSISNGGISVTTRIPATNFSTPNDTAANGYTAHNATASAVTITLKQRDYTEDFTELQWATVTPQMIQNTFLPSMVKQLANGIVVDALGLITSSLFTTTHTVTSSSLAVATDVFALSQKLTTNEVPFNDRMLVCSPTFYQGLIGNINPAYVYGATTAIQDYHGIKLGGFDPIFEYPRLVNTLSGVGGSKYSDGGSTDKLVAVALQKQALCVAMRAPVDVNNGLVQTATATDPTSGVSLQVRLMYDIPRGVWKIATTSIYGVAVGNTKAAIPVLSTSAVAL